MTKPLYLSNLCTFGVIAILCSISISLAGDMDKEPINTISGLPSEVPDVMIVKFKDGVPDVRISNIHKMNGVTELRKSYKEGRFVVIHTGGQNVDGILAKYKTNPDVEYVEKNLYRYPCMIPDDPYYNPYQWNLTRINCEKAWDISTGEGVIVAILDTGVDIMHPDLANTKFVQGYDFINNDSDPADDNGHGTHMAGIIAQSTNNGRGTAGIAFNSTIMPVKVLGRFGGTDADISDGIYFAVDNGAKIINMSFGGVDSSTTLFRAISYAVEHDVLLIASAGNEGNDSPLYPSAYDSVISVGATNYNNQLASYSNFGNTIDLCAPGGDEGDYNNDGFYDYILQGTFKKSKNGYGYYFYAGTSIACAHVSGVSALVLSANPSLSAQQVRIIMESTATNLDIKDRVDCRLVNAESAVKFAIKLR